VLTVALVLLGWLVLGYPAAVLAAARLRRRRIRRDPRHRPPVVVVVPACNEARALPGRLANLLDQSHPPRAIVVVTDGSSDDTHAAARAAAADDRRIVVLEPGPRRGKLAAIGRALEACPGEDLGGAALVVLTDANTYFEQDALGRLCAHFADPEVGSVSGARRVAPEGALAAGLASYERRLLRAESDLGCAIGAAGELLALRLDLARRIIPALDAATVNDDFALAMGVVRARKRHLFDGALRATEAPPARRREELGRRTRISAGRARDLARLVQGPWLLARPWIAFAIFSHKGLRLLAPVLVLAPLAAALSAAGAIGNAARATALLALATPAAARLIPAGAGGRTGTLLLTGADLLTDAALYWAGGLLGLGFAALGRAPWPREPR